MPAHQPNTDRVYLTGRVTTELVDLISPVPSKRLVRATEADVRAWFREAWQRRDIYPDEQSNWMVAIRINTIVDRANARAGKDFSAAALKEQRQRYLDALGSARALKRTLSPLKEHLLSLRGMLQGPQVLELDFRPLAEEIAAVEKIEAALGEFLTCCQPPKLRDHQDEIVWIAESAKKAWTLMRAEISANEAKMPPFNQGPDGPLARFVQLVMEGIGLVSEGRRKSSLETISDHLRDRHNRRRDRKKVGKEGGQPI